MVQPDGETAVAVGAGAEFKGCVELIDGRAKRLLKSAGRWCIQVWRLKPLTAARFSLYNYQRKAL